MQPIRRITYEQVLPAGFFTIPKSVYASLPFALSENEGAIATLFRHESTRHDIIIYTDEEKLRLVGIFPKGLGQCFFGFWESTNDLQRNHEAFGMLEDDARKEGRNEIIGPLNFTTYQSYRLRLGIPSWINFDKEPVNPPYYPTLLEAMGFGKHLLFESRLIKEADIPNVYLKKSDVVAKFKEASLEHIPLTPQTWQKHHFEIYELIDTIFKANPLYRTISYEQFSALYSEAFSLMLCPYSSVLFRDGRDEKLIAFSFCHPKYTGLALPPDGKFIYERDFARLKEKTLLVKSIGVHPEFRQRGLMNALAAYSMLTFKNLYQDVIFCLTRNDNVSNNFTKDLPYEKAEYALFSKQLT